MDLFVLAVIGVVAGIAAFFMLKARGREAHPLICVVTGVVGVLLGGLIVAPLLTLVGMPGGRTALTDPLGMVSYVFGVVGALAALWFATLGDRHRTGSSA